jgi:hypothetical protein
MSRIGTGHPINQAERRFVMRSMLTAQQKERKSFTKRNTKTALVLCLAVLGTAIEARAAQANSKR